ncbi:unnamed protein product [Musa acuminata subsp. burmannicoides]
MVLKVAIELGLLQIIVKSGPATPLSSEEIAAQLPSANLEAAAAWVDRILRLLAANKIVGCVVEAGADDRRSRKYRMAPICKYLTENEDGSLANLLLMHHDKVFLDLWYYSHSLLERELTWHYLKGSVLDGGLRLWPPTGCRVSTTKAPIHGSTRYSTRPCGPHRRYRQPTSPHLRRLRRREGARRRGRWRRCHLGMITSRHPTSRAST